MMISPDVAQFTTLDYERVDDIIQVGRNAAVPALAQIRQLLAPKPRTKSPVS